MGGKRAVRFMALRELMLAEKDFIRKVAKSQPGLQLRKLIQQATPNQIRTMQQIIIGHYKDIPFASRTIKSLHSARKVKFIQNNFHPEKSLGTVDEARGLLLKILSVLRYFAKNCAKSK